MLNPAKSDFSKRHVENTTFFDEKLNNYGGGSIITAKLTEESVLKGFQDIAIKMSVNVLCECSSGFLNHKTEGMTIRRSLSSYAIIC